MRVGLIMAGGRGERMRASGVEVPKPLVTVGGSTLLEWNVRAVLRTDVDIVAVSISEEADDIATFIEARCAPIVTSQGRSFELVVESEPLGNVGCVRRFAGKARSLLVTFADNLTALPMQRLLQHHSALGRAMTLAVHDQPFLVPFGVLAVHGDEVVSYEEKPVMPITVASGTAALSPEAIMIAAEMVPPIGLVSLFDTVRERGGGVSAFRHSAPWIDVNDAEAVRVSEELLRRTGQAFSPED